MWAPTQPRNCRLCALPAVGGCAGNDTLLWAFRAVMRASPRARLSLVTCGAHSLGPYTGAAALAAHASIGKMCSMLDELSGAMHRLEVVELADYLLTDAAFCSGPSLYPYRALP